MSIDSGNLPTSPYAPPQGRGSQTLDELPALSHSGFGIASFLISILVGIGAFIVILLASFAEASTPEGINEESALALIMGLSIFGMVGLNILGIGLGVAGVCQADRSRIFAILGLVFNGLVILGVIGLMAVGVAIGG
ncbi:hypothetical protein Pla52o_24390 [Novipirellula galeiformis]|uniref:Uncharacterized protein n=1 Tax=Novipirellula galeiformis TaxID=2528004 RepID=A0A5C6CGQ3_9BACT|nr:hypothetical protein [Novipirellula galeiformis]TWU22907.1 hypothetical protein Pla52o_24390 [Novipirellula galeiformis]